jgi:hypothetical protein
MPINIPDGYQTNSYGFAIFSNTNPEPQNGDSKSYPNPILYKTNVKTKNCVSEEAPKSPRIETETFNETLLTQ